MAIIKKAFWDSEKNQEFFMNEESTVTHRIKFGDNALIEVIEGDVVITTEKGQKLSVSNLLERLEALETAYMEDKLGLIPGKIET